MRRVTVHVLLQDHDQPRGVESNREQDPRQVGLKLAHKGETRGLRLQLHQQDQGQQAGLPNLRLREPS